MPPIPSDRELDEVLRCTNAPHLVARKDKPRAASSADGEVDRKPLSEVTGSLSSSSLYFLLCFPFHALLGFLSLLVRPLFSLVSAPAFSAKAL